MEHNILATRYARGFIDNIKSDEQLLKLLTGCNSILVFWQTTPELRTLLPHPAIRLEEKHEVIKQLLANKIEQDWIDYLIFLVSKKRINLLPLIIDKISILSNKRLKIKKIVIESAVELAETDKLTIKTKLEQIFGLKIAMDIKINADLISGIIMRVDDFVLDNTLIKQLYDLQNMLLNEKDLLL